MNHFNANGFGQEAMWDNFQDGQLFADYNALLQQANDFYCSISSEDVTSPSSGSSSPHPSSRRASKALSQVRESLPDKIERRRAQNRTSQRAYRDRKDKHQRDLEEQIVEWKEKHKQLSDTFSAQNKEIHRLKGQIDDLNSQIAGLQTSMPTIWNQMNQSPAEFDLVPFYGSIRH